jgi:hypothetical protein
MIASLELGRFRLSVIIGQSGGAFELSRRMIGEIVDGDMNPRGTFLAERTLGANWVSTPLEYG